MAIPEICNLSGPSQLVLSCCLRPSTAGTYGEVQPFAWHDMAIRRLLEAVWISTWLGDATPVRVAGERSLVSCTWAGPHKSCNREEKVNGSRFNNGFARNGNHQCPEGCDRTSGTTVLHVGGLSILLGYRAKIGAWLIVVFLLIVTPLMHNFWGLTHPMMAQVQMIMFLKNVSMLGGALLIAQFGAGPLSLDARRSL